MKRNTVPSISYANTMTSWSKYWPSALICLSLLAYITLMSANAVWMGDDITYQFSFSTQGPIETLADVFQSQVAHYQTMNGRFPAHFLVQVMLVFVGQTGFAIMNGIMWVLLIFLIMRVLRKPMSDWRMLAMTVILALAAFPTKYVPTCQVGYIWMFCAVLVWLLLFRHFSRPQGNAWHLLWLVPLSVLAGWTQEALVIGISAALIVFMIGHWRQATLAQWGMFISFGLGALLLCLSPATISRTGEVHASVDFLPDWALSLIRCACYLRLTYLLILEVIVIKIRCHIRWGEVYRANPFLWNAWGVLLIFNILVGVFGNRQLFGVELISLLLMAQLFEQYIASRKFATLAYGLLVLVVVAVGIRNVRYLREDREIFSSVTEQFSSSADGIVHYNLTSKNVTFRESYPSDAYTWYTTGTIERLLHKQGEPAEKHLTILPVGVESLKEEGCFHNAAGSLLVVIDKSAEPANVFVNREFGIAGIHIPFKPLSMPMAYPIYEDDSVRIFQTYDKVPFLHTTEAHIIR